MRVLLIGNYPHDRQESMTRFAAMMLRGLQDCRVEAELIAPEPFFGRLRKSGQGLGKWLGYLDKFVLFPLQLRHRLASLDSKRNHQLIVHICDHSNSMYVEHAGHRPTVVTCHDMGAVRGALGEETECPASRMGKVLQRWIARGLGRADTVACVSEATRQDVERIVRSPAGTVPKTRTILLGQNTSYGRVDAETANNRLEAVLGLQRETRFLLNVGSSLPRKNRDGVLRIFARVKDSWDGMLIFAGQPLPASLIGLARKLGVLERVIEVVKPDNNVLEALYNRAFALLFPSKFEGFGWPVIEAQACGCPVLCSDATSLAEVADHSAFVRSWEAEKDFANEILRLDCDQAARDQWKRLGFLNLERFQTDRMIREYLQLYREIVCACNNDRAHAIYLNATHRRRY